jgi:hypothetical protein
MVDLPQKTWQKPELVIIVRNHPEENVLLSCKTSQNLRHHHPCRDRWGRRLSQLGNS